MSSDEQWLQDQGFGIEVEEEHADLFWTHLLYQKPSTGRVPRYGRGSTQAESIRSARRRYQVEQLGIDPSTE